MKITKFYFISNFVIVGSLNLGFSSNIYKIYISLFSKNALISIFISSINLLYYFLDEFYFLISNKIFNYSLSFHFYLFN